MVLAALIGRLAAYIVFGQCTYSWEDEVST